MGVVDEILWKSKSLRFRKMEGVLRAWQVPSTVDKFGTTY